MRPVDILLTSESDSFAAIPRDLNKWCPHGPMALTFFKNEITDRTE
jgi:hypothetical protein